ncbi:MAG: hypothetical protein MJ066_05965, partial [Clostridia bacterium]|nr:hypothetical protein [Clostridia bacterium]
MYNLVNSFKNRKVSFGNKIINTLFWPSLIMMALVSVVAVSSTVIVGNIVGEDGLCAVNLVFPFYVIANFFGCIIGMGSFILYFRYLGESKKEDADKIFTQGLFLSIVIGLLLFWIMFFCQNLFLNNLDLNESVRAEVQAFWKFEKYLIGIVPINFFLLQMIYTDASINLAANVSLFVFGIGLSVLFTKLYGTMGASLGMFISTVLSILILSIHFFTKENVFKFKWHFSWKDVGKVCKLSLVDSSKYLDSGLLLAFINYYVLRNFSQTMLSITSVVLSIFDILVVFDAVGAAYTPVSEVYLGEGNNLDQKKCAKYSFLLSLVFGCVGMVIMLIVAPYIPSFCGISLESDIVIATQSIRLYSLCMPFISMCFMLISQYVIVRKICLAVMFEWTINFVAPVICIMIFGKIIGFNGIWIAFIVAEIMTLIGFVVGIRFIAKKQNVFLISDCEFPIFSQSYIVSKENSVSARDCVRDFLMLNEVPNDIVLKVMLLIEESAMIVFEKNKKKKVIIQFTVQIHDDEITVYERDNGIYFELSDTNSKLNDFRQYFYNPIQRPSNNFV